MWDGANLSLENFLSFFRLQVPYAVHFLCMVLVTATSEIHRLSQFAWYSGFGLHTVATLIMLSEKHCKFSIRLQWCCGGALSPTIYYIFAENNDGGN